MQQEINHLADFILSKIPDSSVSQQNRKKFRESLVSELVKKYTSHWYPESSQQGSGYRAIANWGSLDPLLLRAIKNSNLDPLVFEKLLSLDMTIWCDPYHVCYRIGDHGTIYTIFEDKKGLIDNAKRSMAEKVAKSNNDFVISAYTTPVVMRRANRAETNGIA
ncbi:hypothetical protein BB560_000898 [Smittium megazygosporum]|uniref:Anti-proliferative protein domain-containing protein n=1 Tax=Smittium megazygosporum TaxID=133381 RepID=A0A2T9ZJ41_9FUNG|nr:hypothetical protein BB560_000898 [Smittium megazygosporum]